MRPNVGSLDRLFERPEGGGIFLSHPPKAGLRPAQRYFGVSGESNITTYRVLKSKRAHERAPWFLTLELCPVGQPECWNTTGAVRFRLAQFIHHDRGAGMDSWSYVFRPPSSERRVPADLMFVYRFNPGQEPHWSLVRGTTGTDIDVTENKIAGLSGLGYSDTGDLLGAYANARRMRSAAAAGVSTQTIKTSFGGPPGLPRRWKKPLGDTIGALDHFLDTGRRRGDNRPHGAQ